MRVVHFLCLPLLQPSALHDSCLQAHPSYCKFHDGGIHVIGPWSLTHIWSSICQMNCLVLEKKSSTSEVLLACKNLLEAAREKTNHTKLLKSLQSKLKYGSHERKGQKRIYRRDEAKFIHSANTS